MAARGHRSARALLACGALTVLVLALAPRADAFVYWAQGFALGRANLDGSHLQLTWTPLQPLDNCDVDVDASHIYYNGLGAIGRGNIDGSGLEPFFIPTPQNSCGIAVDGAHIYYANRSAIGRANLDGSGVEPNFIPHAGGFTGGIAVDSEHIYWGNNGEGWIGRANIDGSNVNPKFIEAPGDPCAVALDATHVYWSVAESQWGPTGVYAAPIVGRKPVPTKLIGSAAGCGVAVDSQYLYWSAENPRSIGRANLDGSAPDPSFIAGGTSASGLALDTLSSPPFFELGKVLRNLHRGIAKLKIHLTTPMRIRFTGKGVQPFARSFHSAGDVLVPVIPTPALKRKLDNKGKAKVKLSLVFVALPGGAPETETRVLTLRKKR